MYIDEIYKFVQDILKKDQKGYATPSEFNRAFKMASHSLFVQRYGLPEDYKPGRAVPTIAYALTQKIEDDTLPFKVINPSLQIDKYGYAILPSEYSHYIAIRKNVKVRNTYCGADAEKNYELQDIDVLMESEWATRVSSYVVGPTAQYPICKFNKGQIEFRPKGLKYVEFVYLKMPADAEWKYTVSAGGREIFDPATSVETDWPVDTHIELKIRIIKLLAISLRDEDIVGVIDQMQQKGN